MSRRTSLVVTLLVSSVLSWGIAPGGAAAPAAQSRDGSGFTVDDMLDVVSLGIGDLSRDGRWLAVVASTLRDRIGIDNSRFGDPTYVAPQKTQVYVIETGSGKSRALFAEKRQVRNPVWSPDGARLALLALRANGVFEPVIWDRATARFTVAAMPPGKALSDNSELHWSPGGDQLIFTLNTAEWRKKAAERFRYETAGPIVFHSSKEEPFLAWLDLRRLSQLRSIAAFDIRSGQTREILAEKRINSYEPSRDGTFLTFGEDITRKTDYDVINGTDNHVQTVPMAGGAPRSIIRNTHGLGNIQWSRGGRHYAYAKDGNIFFGSVDDKEPRQITGKKDEKTEKAEPAEPPKGDEPEKTPQRETFSPVSISPEGDRLIATNRQGMWLIDPASGARELFVKVEEDNAEAPRYQFLDWDPKGENIYLTYASRTKWERGLVRYNVASKKMADLLKDGRLYGGGRGGFRLSDDGSTFTFSAGGGNRPLDIYVADCDFKNVRKLMESNPQLAGKKFGETELVGYFDTDGKKNYGVVYYPVDYQHGTKYPTVFNIYEQFFDDTFNGTIALLNTHGYVVMQPSVNLQIGFPGEAWLKGVTAAANKLVEMGIADPDRLGVQGTSYGGYATNLLITQTDRFKAAINISGKVNMVSFYTDSPRLGVRNTHAPEKSQDRIGGTLWQQPQKYIQHSAVMFADRIKTPLLLISGELDSNVPARQAMEMYYALRRLDKEVAWVQYMRGGHGMPTTTVEEVQDYHKRILDWYDSHLKKAGKTESPPR
jgi:dipeptidyl aminopeptidase/acylaminoacyl peptidase